MTRPRCAKHLPYGQREGVAPPGRKPDPMPAKAEPNPGSGGSSVSGVVAIPLAAITIDRKVHARVRLDAGTVEEYRAAMVGGAEFPPVVAFEEGATYWLADGFMRVEAAEKAGLISVKVDVRQGGLREATMFAAGANVAHGLPRTNADKRRAVEMLLADADWHAWSDGQIAKAAGVTDKTVAKYRRDLPRPAAHPGNSGVTERHYRTKHGSAAVMRIAAAPRGPRPGPALFLRGAVPRSRIPSAAGCPAAQQVGGDGSLTASAELRTESSNSGNGEVAEAVDTLLRAAGKVSDFGAEVLRSQLGPERLAAASSRLKELSDLLGRCASLA